MAATCGSTARRTLQFSCSSAKTVLTHSPSSCHSPFTPEAAAKLAGLASSKPNSASRFSLHKLTSSRLPVPLGAALSLMPLHSVTASSLFTSLLSLHNQSWGCLSEGFATPL